MVTLFVRHSFADYDAWRTVYDEVESRHAELGIRGAAVYRTVDNPSEVTVTHEFDDVESARAFIDGETIRSAMEQAGVTGEPEVWFGTATG
jgi:quinol monooxygenase YgiN